MTWYTESAVTTHIQAVIAYGKGGNKYLYFRLSDYDMAQDQTSDKDYCNPTGFDDRGVITVNGQAIKILRWCKKYNDSSNHYLELTALTDQGSAYIINQFSRASKSVELDIDGKKITISAEGFTAAWGKSTDKAL